MVVAIDGPAGSGKTTIARRVAEALDLPHLDTGAMYRAFTLKAIDEQISPSDQAAIEALSAKTSITLDDDRVLLDGRDVTTEIRSAEVTAAVSPIAAVPQLRAWMVERQRAQVGESGAVIEGRDIGTVVFPDAQLKVFLTASPEERARRRTEQDAVVGRETTVEQTLEAINRRDAIDAERDASPLVVAHDAVLLDSTGRSIDEVVEQICELARDRMGTKG